MLMLSAPIAYIRGDRYLISRNTMCRSISLALSNANHDFSSTRLNAAIPKHFTTEDSLQPFRGYPKP